MSILNYERERERECQAKTVYTNERGDVFVIRMSVDLNSRFNDLTLRKRVNRDTLYKTEIR